MVPQPLSSQAKFYPAFISSWVKGLQLFVTGSGLNSLHLKSNILRLEEVLPRENIPECEESVLPCPPCSFTKRIEKILILSPLIHFFSGEKSSHHFHLSLCENSSIFLGPFLVQWGHGPGWQGSEFQIQLSPAFGQWQDDALLLVFLEAGVPWRWSHQEASDD